MPSEQAAPSTGASRRNGCASALIAHPHEQRRPFESSGQTPPAQAQWAPRGGSETGMPAARANVAAAGECTSNVTMIPGVAINAIAATTVGSLGARNGGLTRPLYGFPP